MGNEDIEALWVSIIESVEKRNGLVARQRVLINERDDAVNRGHARQMLEKSEALAQSSTDLMESCAAICDQLADYKRALVADFTRKNIAAHEALIPIRERLRELRPQVMELEEQERAEIERITPKVDRIAGQKRQREQFIVDVEFDNRNAVELVRIAKAAV